MRTILVVEDEPQIAALVRDYLEHAGLRRHHRGAMAPRPSRSPAPGGPTRSSSTSACRASTGSTSSGDPPRLARPDPHPLGPRRRDRPRHRPRARRGRLRREAVQPASSSPASGPCSAASRRPRWRDERIAAGDLELDLARRRVTAAGRVVTLTPTEFELLATLARSRAASGRAPSCSTPSTGSASRPTSGPSTATSATCAASSSRTTRRRATSARSTAWATRWRSPTRERPRSTAAASRATDRTASRGARDRVPRDWHGGGAAGAQRTRRAGAARAGAGSSAACSSRSCSSSRWSPRSRRGSRPRSSACSPRRRRRHPSRRSRSRRARAWRSSASARVFGAAVRPLAEIADATDASRTASPASASSPAARVPSAASPPRSTRWPSGSTGRATTGARCSPT